MELGKVMEGIMVLVPPLIPLKWMHLCITQSTATPIQLPQHRNRANSTSSIRIEQSLPNITGSIEDNGMFDSGDDALVTGALYVGTSSSRNWSQSYGHKNTSQKLCLDASRSSTIYSDNANVRPNSLSLIFVIKY